MPNHVENDLYLSGSKEDVQAVLKFIGALQDPPVFDFSKVIPYPDEFRERDESAARFGYDKNNALHGEAREEARRQHVAKYGDDKDGFNSGGYEWRVDNWQTKWGAYDLQRRDYQGVCLTYQTAWSPAQNVISELAKKFPEVSFSLEYFERGMGFCGGLQCISKDDFYDDEKTWQAGEISDEWHCDQYKGNRGG